MSDVLTTVTLPDGRYAMSDAELRRCPICTRAGTIRIVIDQERRQVHRACAGPACDFVGARWSVARGFGRRLVRLTNAEAA